MNPNDVHDRAMRSLFCLVVAASACSMAACSTRPNEEFCCTSPDDCAAFGVTDPSRDCSAGLACKDHACVVPDCAKDGCEAAMPVCTIDTGLCGGCTESSECAHFGDTTVCDAMSGACVECLASSDCAPGRPVCDNTMCRACKLDSECASSACAEDGTCVLEENAIYVAPTGSDTGSCTRSSPCQHLQFGLSKSTTTRNHLVLASGTYAKDTAPVLSITTATTPSASIVIHGGHAIITTALPTDGMGAFEISVPTELHDLNFVLSHGTDQAIRTATSLTARRLHIQSDRGIAVFQGSTTMEDLSIESIQGPGIGIAGGSLKVNRAVLRGGAKGIVAAGAVEVDLSNTLVFGTTDTGIDLGTDGQVHGTLDSVTITDTGTMSTGTTGLNCSSGITVRSTIVWEPLTPNQPASGACSFTSSIVGPSGVIGAMNVDPMFAGPATRDYHLGPSSPAKDMVNDGPATDFEGDPRPRGARFDIGADEAP